MKKSRYTPEQFQQLLIACADLPFLHQPRGKADYMDDVLTTVLDFHMQGMVVSNALGHFRDQVQNQHGIDTHAQLQAVLDRFPDTKEGNKDASRFLWNNAHWMRVELLRRLLTYLASINVTDQPSLQAWAHQANFERDFHEKVKGLGVAVFHWLQLRCGVSTIKPDVWVINFAKRVTGKRFSEGTLVEIFTKLAPLLGESLETIDVTIWYYEKMAMGTKDVPALRIAFWHMLKQQLEDRLKGDGPDTVSWQLVLDDKALLRYQVAGLTLVPDRSLFGADQPGITTVTLRQSLWSEGLALTLVVRHETALAEELFERLKAPLEESGWEVSNAPCFDASLEVEYLMLPPTMNFEELNEKVLAVAGQVVAGLPPYQPTSVKHDADPEIRRAELPEH